MIQPTINNYESYKDKIYILNPDTGKWVTAGEWLKEADPTRAQLVGIKTDFYFLVFNKKYLPGRYTFDEAQEAAAAFKIAGFDHAFRCPRRNERNYIYDAYYSGLKEILKKIGGDELKEVEWTCEKDAYFLSASRCLATGSWFFSGGPGYAHSYGLYNSFRALPVLLLDVSEANA